MSRRVLLAGIMGSAASIGLSSCSKEDILSKYGRVIYQKDVSQKHIYILGQEPQKDLRGNLVQPTPAVQRDIYRIGEHLLKEKNIELVVTERFPYIKNYLHAPVITGFIEVDRYISEKYGRRALRELHKVNDIQLEKLIGEVPFASAVHLLLWREMSNILFGGEDTYAELGESMIRELAKYRFKPDQILPNDYLVALNYFAERRSAGLLKNTVNIIETKSFGNSSIKPRALLVVEYSCLDEIIRFVDKDEVNIPSASIQLEPSAPAKILKGVSEKLELSSRGCGVTVIMPHSIPPKDWEKVEQDARLSCKPEPNAVTKTAHEPCAQK